MSFLPVYSLLWIPSAYTRRVAASQAYAKQPGKPSIPALMQSSQKFQQRMQQDLKTPHPLQNRQRKEQIWNPCWMARDCESMTAEVAAFHSHPASALSGGTEGMYNQLQSCKCMSHASLARGCQGVPQWC